MGLKKWNTFPGSKSSLSGERVGGGDNDSYCDSEASLDDGSCYDNLEDVASPPPPDLGHQSLDLRHQDAVSLRVGFLFQISLRFFYKSTCFRMTKLVTITL